MTDGLRALVAGATGLVGGQLVQVLSRHTAYREITVLTRRPYPDPPSKVTPIMTDYERLAEVGEGLAADHVFCALGLTMKKAGTRERFYRVDHDYVVELARQTLRHCASHFSLVSSLGANPGARSYYLRVKGEVEAAVLAMAWPGVVLVRPSVIGGRRDDVRPMERLGERLLRWAPRRIRTVPAALIARAMVATAVGAPAGRRVIESRELWTHAEG